MSTMMNASVTAPIPPKPIRKPGKVKLVRALYKYIAQHDQYMSQPDELSFEAGELLFVYDNNLEPNWLKAKCGTRDGLVPVNYVEEQTKEIELPLHDAARRGNISLLKEYIKQGVSTTGLDVMGNTALHWASGAGHLDCVQELMNVPNPKINVQNKMGETPLHTAASRGHHEIVNVLLQCGANPIVKNNDGLMAEQLSFNLSIKNTIQLSRCDSVKILGYTADDYNDDSD